jgi:hypothetical protein
VSRVVTIIFHPAPAADAGALTVAFARLRRANAERHVAGFTAGGAEVRVVEALEDGETFGSRLRKEVAAAGADGLVVLGSGSIPMATASDRRAFVAAAAGPPGQALANNAYSADVIAIAGAARLTVIPDLAADNGLPRWLAESAGFAVSDRRRSWRLQVDLDSPLDALLVRPAHSEGVLAAAGIAMEPVVAALGGLRSIAADPGAELVVAGRTSSASLAWLERRTRSRTRALIEERGFRTRTAGQRPVRSVLGLVLDRDGPAAIGDRLAELGDGAVVDTRVLMAHRCGPDESSWPTPEDRFASDLLLPERIADPWLRSLTTAARDAPIPILLGGHTVVGPGVRLVFGSGRRWT